MKSGVLNGAVPCELIVAPKHNALAASSVMNRWYHDMLSCARMQCFGEAACSTAACSSSTASKVGCV